MGEFSKDMQTQERQESPRKLSPILSTPLVFIRGDANMEKVSYRANTIFRNLLTVKKLSFSSMDLISHREEVVHLNQW